MRKNSKQKRDLAAAQRGLIVQRVLVDGLSPAAAGRPFGLNSRQVGRLLAAYRRHGMASLRGEMPAGPAPYRRMAAWFSWLALRLGGLGGAAAQHRAGPGPHPPAGRSDPARRFRWN